MDRKKKTLINVIIIFSFILPIALINPLFGYGFDDQSSASRISINSNNNLSISDNSGSSSNLNIFPASKLLKRGKKLKFRIDSEEISGISERSGLRVKSIKRGFLWSVNNVEGGNRKIGKISRHGVYRAPKNISGSKHVRISAYNTELGLKTAKSEVTIVSSKKYKNGILAIKAKWVSGKASRVSGSGIPEEVRKVRGVAVNNLTGEKYYAGPVDVEDRVLEFPGVPLEGSYTVTLEGIDESGNVIYRGTVQGVKAVAPDERPKPVTIILKIVDGEIEVSSISPAISEINVGDTEQFSAEVTGAFDPTGKPLKWSVIGGSKYGTISADGLYTAPAIIPSPATAKIRAMSKADSSKYSELSFTVIGNVTVTVSPPTASVSSGGTSKFSASVSGAEDKTVAWLVDGGSSNGTVDSTGLYTAPSVLTTTLVTVRATSSVDTSKSGTASVTVNPPAVPEVSSTNPASGATGVSVGTTISATFNEAMDVSTINGSTFTVSGASGTVSYVSGTKTAVFTPSSALGFDTVYTATITTGVKSSAGISFASSNTWSFTTESEGGDVIPPLVSSTYPANGATSVPITTTISATFSEDMQASTIHGDSFIVPGASGTVSYVSGTKTAVFTPSSSLSYDTVYTATIYSYVTDLADNTLTSDYIWSFTTGSETDGTPPFVSSSSPANYSTSVSINTTISVNFSEAIDPATINDSSFMVSGITGTVSYDAELFRAVFTPSAHLNYETVYTATVTTAVKDLAGNNMESNYICSFITGASSTGTSAFATWSKTFEGSLYDSEFNDVKVTSEGGYIAVGVTSNPDWGDDDACIVKVNEDSSVAWQKTYGGTNDEQARAVYPTSDGGCVVVGYTYSFGAGSSDMFILKLQSDGTIEWQKMVGGPNDESAESVQQTSDGGYIVAGYTNSFSSVSGEYDILVLKIDSGGTMTWQKIYGEIYSNELAFSIQETSDGGYIIGGKKDLYLEVSGYDLWFIKINSDGSINWQKKYDEVSTYEISSIQQTSDGGYVAVGTIFDSFATTGYDAYIIRIDSIGNGIWKRQISEFSFEIFKSVQETSDGGYIVAGFTASFAPSGDESGLLIKFNSDGTIAWQKQYYADFSVLGEGFNSVQQTPDGGYILAGYADPYGYDIHYPWLLKLDSDGSTAGGCYLIEDITSAVTSNVAPSENFTSITESVGESTEASGIYETGIVITDTTECTGASLLSVWANVYGQTGGGEQAHSIQQTTDGGFIAAGWTDSIGSGDRDLSVLKLKPNGMMEWQGIYGGTLTDSSNKIAAIQLSDGSYLLSGTTQSEGAGGQDGCLLKLDSYGGVIWQKTYGGTNDDTINSIQQTSDGGFIVAGDKWVGTPQWDCWVMKLSSDGSIEWQKTYGASGYQGAASIKQTSGGGYIMAGSASSFGAGSNDMWILKLNSDGTVAWQKTFGGSNNELSHSIQQTSDGGYIVAGGTVSYGAGSTDFWLIKLLSDGTVEWEKAFGGSGIDVAYSVVQTSDGGYITTGGTKSYGASTGFNDVWVLKLNADGSVAWQKTYGSIYDDLAQYIQQTAQGQYVIAGWTTSLGFGSNDMFIMKMDANGNIGSDCYLVGNTSVTASDTSATIYNSTIPDVDSSDVPADSTLSETFDSIYYTYICTDIPM